MFGNPYVITQENIVEINLSLGNIKPDEEMFNYDQEINGKVYT